MNPPKSQLLSNILPWYSCLQHGCLQELLARLSTLPYMNIPIVGNTLSGDPESQADASVSSLGTCGTITAHFSEFHLCFVVVVVCLFVCFVGPGVLPYSPGWPGTNKDSPCLCFLSGGISYVPSHLGFCLVLQTVLHTRPRQDLLKGSLPCSLWSLAQHRTWNKGISGSRCSVAVSQSQDTAHQALPAAQMGPVRWGRTDFPSGLPGCCHLPWGCCLGAFLVCSCFNPIHGGHSHVIGLSRH